MIFPVAAPAKAWVPGLCAWLVTATAYQRRLRSLCGGGRVFVLILSLFLVSCRTALPPEPADVARVQAAYNGVRPTAFEAKQSLVFGFRPHWWWPTVRMTTLGYATVNPRTGDYAVVCLSPMGLKLFEVERKDGRTEARIAMPVKGDPDEVGRAMGRDISRLYFDLVPPPDAKVSRKRESLVFRSSTGEDWREYEFDILTTRLVRKTESRGGECSTVTFGDYERFSCGVLPTTMELINQKSRYTLTLRTLDIRAAK